MVLFLPTLGLSQNSTLGFAKLISGHDGIYSSGIASLEKIYFSFGMHSGQGDTKRPQPNSKAIYQAYYTHPYCFQLSKEIYWQRVFSAIARYTKWGKGNCAHRIKN
jgi:hypothetical protein